MQELDEIIQIAYTWEKPGVLATIVKTEGSSYRKPGACMLISEEGKAIGAVSGGCIEKEVIRRSQEVFKTGTPLLIEYDGRYRLGCNGILYILIEPFIIQKGSDFWQHYFLGFTNRQPMRLISFFGGEVEGSAIEFENREGFLIDSSKSLADFDRMKQPGEDVFIRELNPARQLYVIGSEIDAFKLAGMSREAGMQVTLIGHPQNPISQAYSDRFQIENIAPESLSVLVKPDERTAIVLMTHSYSRDLSYLNAILELPAVPYLGILGPKQRRNSLISEAFEFLGMLPDWLDTSLRGPAGLDLGGELPGEIAVSILAEIQSVFSGHRAAPLTQKETNIHDVAFKQKEESA